MMGNRAAVTVKKIRLALCLYQEEFSKHVGISKQTVWNYEHGHRIPRLAIVKRLMKAADEAGIKVTVDDFLT